MVRLKRLLPFPRSCLAFRLPLTRRRRTSCVLVPRKRKDTCHRLGWFLRRLLRTVPAYVPLILLPERRLLDLYILYVGFYGSFVSTNMYNSCPSQFAFWFYLPLLLLLRFWPAAQITFMHFTAHAYIFFPLYTLPAITAHYLPRFTTVCSLPTTCLARLFPPAGVCGSAFFTRWYCSALLAMRFSFCWLYSAVIRSVLRTGHLPPPPPATQVPYPFSHVQDLRALLVFRFTPFIRLLYLHFWQNALRFITRHLVGYLPFTCALHTTLRFFYRSISDGDWFRFAFVLLPTTGGVKENYSWTSPRSLPAYH